MQLRLSALFAALALAGCINGSVIRVEPTASPETSNLAPGDRYEQVSGRDATMIATMRASAPRAPEVAIGANYEADRVALNAKSYIRIGNGWFRGDAAQAREHAIEQGHQVGADRILLYPAAEAIGQSRDELLAVYYVRFQLPFGATFRNLTAAERETLGETGGVQIGSVVDATPAARSNLLPGDIVLMLNGKPVADKQDFRAALKANEGKSITLSLRRNGEPLQRVVRLGMMPTSP